MCTLPIVICINDINGRFIIFKYNMGKVTHFGCKTYFRIISLISNLSTERVISIHCEFNCECFTSCVIVYAYCYLLCFRAFLMLH